MKIFVVSTALIGAFVLSGCDKVAPPAENAASVEPMAEPQVVSTPVFVPYLIDSPIFGVFTPDFYYSVRSKGAATPENGGKNHVALEFWGMSVDEVEQKVHAQLLAAGFNVISRDSGNGSWAARYSSTQHSEILVNVAPMAARKPTTPNGVGTVYFEWKD